MQIENYSWDFAGGMFAILAFYGGINLILLAICWWRESLKEKKKKEKGERELWED